MANITKAAVERAKSPEDGQIFIRDDELTGLALRVTAGGAKSFVFEGRVRGRPRRITLGQYPALPVLLARKKALEVKTAIVQGEDPAAERRRKGNEAVFAELVEAYFERHAKPHKRERSWREDERLLARYVPQSWHRRRLCPTSTAMRSRVCTAVLANTTAATLRTT